VGGVIREVFVRLGIDIILNYVSLASGRRNIRKRRK